MERREGGDEQGKEEGKEGREKDPRQAYRSEAVCCLKSDIYLEMNSLSALETHSTKCIHLAFIAHSIITSFLCLPFTWPSSEYEDKVYVSATAEQCEEYEILLAGDLQGKRASTGLCQGELDLLGAGCHGLLSLT